MLNEKGAESREPRRDAGDGASQELYTLAGTTRWGARRRWKRELAIFDFVTRQVASGAAILEVGPGRGEFARIARQRGFRYLGIEPSEALRLPLLEDGFEVSGDSIPPIGLGDESVDMVHSHALIEHLESYSMVAEYFREARRVLRRSGIFSSIVPNCETMGGLFYTYDYQHTFVTTRGRLESLLVDTGFEVVAARSFLTGLGFSPLRRVDRILAHSTLFLMRSPPVYASVRALVGQEVFARIHKNLFDETVVIGRKV